MPPVPDAVLRYAMALPDEWTLYRSVNNGRLAFAISPDGQKLAVVATDKAGARRVLVRRLDETEFRELPGTDGSQGVFWAPDSHRLGFVVPGGVRRADLSGAGSQSMVTGSGLAGASWNGRDEILASLGEPNLVRWPAAGGSPQPFAETPGNRTARLQPSWLPDDSFMFLDVHSPRLVSVMIQSTDKAAHTIAQIEPEGAGTVTAFYASNHLVVGRTELGGRSLLTAQRFDLASRRLSGEPVSLAADVNPTFSVSSNGVLVYGRGRFSIERLMWLDAKGSIISTAGERLQMANFDLSSDERSVVMQGIGTGLQSHDLIRGVTTQLNPAGVDPVWSPDGKQIAFSIVGPPNQGVYVMPAFGGTPRRVYEFPMSAQTYIDGWSNDGKWLAGHVGASTGSGILIPLAAGAKPILFEEKSEGGAGIDEGRFSPDGRWLAYGINAQAGSDVYVIPLPPTGERWKVSVAGGAQPRWRADGRALYYLSLSGTMMMVDVVGKAGAPVSAPRAVFETGLQVQPAYDQYAVNRDGTRFLVRRPDDVGRLMQNQVYVIINWPALLKGAP
jgi:Tol biopolymer transport system component